MEENIHADLLTPFNGQMQSGIHPMTTGRSRVISEKHVANAANGLQPAVTMQPTLAGEAGTPVGVVIAEVVCPDHDENELFAGLGAFIRAELPAQKTPAEIALARLLGELCLKGRNLAAGAILSTDIKLLRVTDAAGHRLLKMIATGTAVVLPPGKDNL
jgi:uncharacterized protein YbjQ (UPF0145 family)